MKVTVSKEWTAEERVDLMSVIFSEIRDVALSKARMEELANIGIKIGRLSYIQLERSRSDYAEFLNDNVRSEW